MNPATIKEYWSEHWKDSTFSIASKSHPVRTWIENKIDNGDGLECLEVGCYPGKFLAVLGEKGYRLSGVDNFEQTEFLEKWLREQNYLTGEIFRCDFRNLVNPKLYDLVCSFGFIEHFENWQEIIKKHVSLTKPEGTIAIEVPNLKSPVYYWLYKLLEPKVLQNHVLDAMTLKGICLVLQKENCEIKSATYIGKFYFRFVTKRRWFYQCVEKIINFLSFIFELTPHSIHSRYIGIIAKKIKQPLH